MPRTRPALSLVMQPPLTWDDPTTATRAELERESFRQEAWADRRIAELIDVALEYRKLCDICTRGKRCHHCARVKNTCEWLARCLIASMGMGSEIGEALKLMERTK